MAVREVLKTYTFEQQRQEINNLSSDVGDANSLTTTSKVITQAINDIVSGSQQLVNATLTGDLTIQGGDIYLQDAATDIFIRDNVLNALLITEGANPYISVDTTNGSELVTIHKNTLIGGNLTVNGDITFRVVKVHLVLLHWEMEILIILYLEQTLIPVLFQTQIMYIT